ncbi:JmjC domain-containing protein [Microbispora sp. NPDC004025]
MNDTTEALDLLFEPVGGIEKFRQEYWPGRFVTAEGSPERLAALTGGRAMTSLEDVLAVYDNPVMVVGPCVVDATGGITDRFLVPPDEALAWYEQGAALEMDFAHFFLPGMSHLVSAARKFFGLPGGTVAKGIVYAAKHGGGFPVHFDAYVNFVFQVAGEKVWRVRENENTTLPIQHYDLAQYPYLPEGVQRVWTGEPPAEGLPDGREVVLRPGSMLFLPRGLWHCTASGEATLSINITLGQPTWLDLVQHAVRRGLLDLDEWRELVWTDADGELTPDARANVERALREAGARLARLTPEDLLGERDQALDPYQETQGSFRRSLGFARMLNVVPPQAPSQPAR